MGSIIGYLDSRAVNGATKRWLDRNSGLNTFVGDSCEAMGSLHLYRASDLPVGISKSQNSTSYAGTGSARCASCDHVLRSDPYLEGTGTGL